MINIYIKKQCFKNDKKLHIKFMLEYNAKPTGPCKTTLWLPMVRHSGIQHDV